MNYIEYIKPVQEIKEYVLDHSKIKTLKVIAKIESNDGKNTLHKKLNSGMHEGSSAIGKYGLMPLTIKDIDDRFKALSDEQIRFKLNRNPELEFDLASKYYDILREELKTTDPGKIGYGWLVGVTGAKKALKIGKNIENHFHVKKIRKALKD
jgi:hypothetical protein